MILNLIFTFFLYQLEIIKILHFSWLNLIQAGQVLLVILIFECPSLHLYVLFNIYLNYLYIIIPKHVLYLLVVSQLSLHISLSLMIIEKSLIGMTKYFHFVASYIAFCFTCFSTPLKGWDGIETSWFDHTLSAGITKIHMILDIWLLFSHDTIWWLFFLGYIILMVPNCP